MRAAFFRTLADLAAHDERIVLLTGDLGFMAIEPFAERFPDRFINVGVAEQNMIGIATGLAEAGFLPFAYSIAPFAVLRPYEFLRNGPLAHRWPVRVAGVGGGFDYAANGISHYGLEDVAVLRALPGFTVLAPADARQTSAVVEATWNLPGPVYYRLGKDDRLEAPGLNGAFAPEEIQIFRDGADMLILALGGMAVEAQAAAGILQKRGVECTVGVVAWVHPAPLEDLLRLLARFPAVVTAEAHYIVGGLGSLAAEAIADNGLACRLIRCGVQSVPDGRIGSQTYLYSRHGLTPEQLAETAWRALHPEEISHAEKTGRP